MDLTTLTALELGAAIRRGEVSPEEAVQAGLDTIAAQGQNSFITRSEEHTSELQSQR